MAETLNIQKNDDAKPNVGVKPANKRSWFKWLLWGLTALILGVLLLTIWAWDNRYSLLEQLAIDRLARDGITAELSINDIGETRAQLSDVKLVYGGEVFFTANRISAEYNWKDALNGKLLAVSLSRANARITLDKNGGIVDEWLPPSLRPQNQSGTAKANTSALPSGGISIKNSVLQAYSPYGKAEVKGDIFFKDAENFTTTLSLLPTELNYGGGNPNVNPNVNGIANANANNNVMRVLGSGAMDMTMKKGLADIEASLAVSEFSHPALDANNVSISITGRPDIAGKSFEGRASIEFEDLKTAHAFTGESRIDWDGRMAQTQSGELEVRGDWAATIDNARIPDPARANALATTLSLYEPLSKSPIAQNFAPKLRDMLRGLFMQSQVKARGSLTRNDLGTVISLSQPATLKSFETRLILAPKSGVPIYAFEGRAQRITAALDARFTQPAGLQLSGLEFSARSVNGISLEGVEEFKAKVKTQNIWESYGQDGRSARLAPLSIALDYDGRRKDKRLTLRGAVDYDGILPGAYVKGLTAQGDMLLTLERSGGLRVGFTPSVNSRLKIDVLETAADWTARDVNANMTPSPELFSRLPIVQDKSRNQAGLILSDITAKLERNSDSARLDVSAHSLSARGELSQDNVQADPDSPLEQIWDIAFTRALVTSDDLPGPETKITMEEGQFDARLLSGELPYFDLTTPAANINTQLIMAKDMRLRVHGTTENFEIDHGGGRVQVSGNELPPIPLDGLVNVKAGRFIGQAKARLPQADNTPIELSYNIYNGAGFADVVIDELRFVPNGLQPQKLISALRGKIAQVDGAASAKIRLEFARGEPMKSSGTAKIINMNLGTAPGPLSGMNMELSMDSVLPLISRGRQRITVSEFDPGIPLRNGEIEFELVDEGVKIFAATWPIGDGAFSLDPFTWKYGADENRLVMRLADVQLGEFMERMGNETIDATGKLQGEFPILISGINVTVEKGSLFVKDGGVIRYTPKTPETEPPISYTQEEAIKILRTRDQARYSSLARDALREFRYRELYVNVDGALDGEVELGTIFHGSNPKVLNGQPFEFDIRVVGELFNIMRSFNSNAQIKSQLEKRGISTGGLAIEP